MTAGRPSSQTLPKVAVVGRGNVAWHLGQALRAAGIQAIEINPHRPESVPADADFILIAVADAAIAEVASRLPAAPGAIVAHTSGSVPLEALAEVSPSSALPGGGFSRQKGKRWEGTGVLYPLQTLTKGKPLDYSALPLLTEGDSEGTLRRLDTLASMISRRVSHADSSARARLHLAAVFACNFTNLMCGIAYDLLEEARLDPTLLWPLVEETVAKLLVLTPREAQTGPAARGDTTVMRRQSDALSPTPSLQAIYNLLSAQILTRRQSPAHLPGS